MEIIFIIVCIFVIRIVQVEKIKTEKLPVTSLPVGHNKEGYFDNTAFTEVYHSVKANK